MREIMHPRRQRVGLGNLASRGRGMREVEEADDRFFRGLSDELVPFEVPVARLHNEPGQLPWFELDEARERLIQFAHRFGSYDWSHDPRQDEQARALATGMVDEPVQGDYEFLWHCLFAVVRADRFQ